MDFGLKEIGLTLLVGAFTILGFELILHIILNWTFTGFLGDKLAFINHAQKSSGSSAEPKDTKDSTLSAVVFVGLCCVFGLLAEDLSYKYEDSVQMPFKWLPEKTVRLLPTDLAKGLGLDPILSRFDSRVSTLVGDLEVEPKISALAKDLASNKAFSTVDKTNGDKMEKWILGQQPIRLGEKESPNDEKLSSKEAAASIMALYYFAKNRVYSVENYYDEMKRIQSRLEFSRSISMIAFIYLILGLLLAILISTKMAIREIVMWKKKGKQSRKTERKTAWQWGLKVFATLSILSFFYFIGLWAYQREAEAYNKRAFGYFSSMLIAQKTPETLIPQNSDKIATAMKLEKYNQLGLNMSYDEGLDKEAIEEGKQSNIPSDYKTITYHWEAPNPAGVTLIFHKGKLVHKSQYGLK